MDVYIARQPIFDKDYNVYAYELLYRDADVNYFDGSVSDNVATSILLTNSFFNFGIDTLVEDKLAFINFGAHLIKMGIPELLDKDKVVIEILETVKPDNKLLNSIKKLVDLGYNIAIDDYTFDYQYKSITDLCNIVKVDFMDCTREQIQSMVIDLKKRKKKLLAEKIETKEEFEWAKSVGFDLYQGYYFSKPSTIKRKTMPDNALQYVRLMSELNADIPDYEKLSRIILLDPGLTYKLLKIVNSNARIKNEIKSIKQALAILGVKEFARWLSLAMVQNMCNLETNEALKYAMTRANFLREIGLNSSLKGSIDELSLMGTLSIIDTVLEMDMEEALKPIPISMEVKDTLLGRETRFSDAYRIVLNYEHGTFDELASYSDRIKYDLHLVPKHYLESVKWAETMFLELSE